MKLSALSILVMAASTPAFATDFILDVNNCTFDNFKGDTSAISLPGDFRHPGLLDNNSVLSYNPSSDGAELAYTNAFSRSQIHMHLMPHSIDGRQVTPFENATLVNDHFGEFFQGSVISQNWYFEISSESLTIRHRFNSWSPFVAPNNNYSYSCKLNAVSL